MHHLKRSGSVTEDGDGEVVKICEHTLDLFGCDLRISTGRVQVVADTSSGGQTEDERKTRP